MAKVQVTKELAEKIKELRLMNKVKAIDLADYIKKSSAFISKLESGDIKTIDYDELLKIFNFISKDDDDLNKFIDRLTLEFNVKELDKQIWFMNFDTVERKIPIPSNLIDYINKKILDLGLTIREMVDYVNKNEDIKDIIEGYNIETSKCQHNRWCSYKPENGRLISFIIMKLNLSEVTNILKKKVDVSNYVTIQSIIYNLLRLEYESQNFLSEEINSRIRDEAVKILTSNKFYSTIEKARLLEATSTQQEHDLLLNEFDIENRKLVNNLLEYISFLSDWNVKYTNDKITLLNENLEWDSSYTLTLASLPFYELNNISKSLKSDLLKDISRLIDEYKNKPEAEKTFETY